MTKFLTSLLLFSAIHLNSSMSAQDIEFWGVVTNGVEGHGAIVSTDGNGENYQIEYTFGGVPLRSALFEQFLEVDSGLLYGSAWAGGNFDNGGLFSYNINTDEFKVLHHFKYEEGYKVGPLVKTSNNKVYGIAHSGINVGGSLFEYNISTSEFNIKVAFDTSTTGTPYSDGLLLATNGKLYGTAGGLKKIYNRGYIFEYDPISEQYNILHHFSDTLQGRAVLGHLIEANNGMFYGMTSIDGLNKKGVIFEFNPLDTNYRVIHHFSGTDGGKPYLNSLIDAGKGRLFGMTHREGVNNKGVLFEYNLNNQQYITHHHFIGSSGEEPYGNLTQATNGKLYAHTRIGGKYGHGTLFTFDTSSNQLTTKINFRQDIEGQQPTGTLIQAKNGKLYSATNIGAKLSHGAILEYDIQSNKLNPLAYFLDRRKGHAPIGKLMHHTNGLLYGNAYGGDNLDGIIYSIDPISSAFKIVHHFEEEAGFNPTGFLCEAENGIIYGLTEHIGVGTSTIDGVIYKFDPNTSKFDTIISLDQSIYGRTPEAGFSKAPSGKLYCPLGLVKTGKSGSLIELNPKNDMIRLIHEFDINTFGGGTPIGPLVVYSNGMMYGVITDGGINGSGGIYAFNSHNKNTDMIYEFSPSTLLSYPSHLSRGPNGLLYGKKSDDNNAFGMIYSFDPITKEFKSLFHNANPDESGYLNTKVALMWASNGNLYGIANRGGKNNFGTIYEINLSNGKFNTKLDFDGNNGRRTSSTFIELYGDPLGLKKHVQNSEVSLIQIFPNPTTDFIELKFNAIQSKVHVELYNIQGMKLKSWDFNNSLSESILLKEYPSGLYLLKATAKGLEKTLSFVKE